MSILYNVEFQWSVQVSAVLRFQCYQPGVVVTLQKNEGKEKIQTGSDCERGVKQRRAPVVAASCCGGKSQPRRRQRQQRTRQVLYGTRVRVALCYPGPSSVRVYTLIRWQVSGTSQGSCNLVEGTADGRQWWKLGGWGKVGLVFNSFFKD